MHEVVADRETVEVVGRRARVRFVRLEESDCWQAEVGLLVRGEWELWDSGAVTAIPVEELPLTAGEAVIGILDRLWVREGEWPRMEPVLKALAALEERPGAGDLRWLEEAADEAMGWAGTRPEQVDACPSCTAVALEEEGRLVRCRACGWLGAARDLAD